MPDLDDRLADYFASLPVNLDHNAIRGQALAQGRRRRTRTRALLAVVVLACTVTVVAVGVTRTSGSSDRVAARGQSYPLLFDDLPRESRQVTVPIYTDAAYVVIHVEIDQPSNMCVLLEVPPTAGSGGGCFPFRTAPAIGQGIATTTDVATGALNYAYEFGAVRADIASVEVTTNEGSFSAPTYAVPGLNMRVYVRSLRATTTRIDKVRAYAANGKVIATEPGSMVPSALTHGTSQLGVSAPPCQAGDLAITLGGSNGATDMEVSTLRVRNISAAACSLPVSLQLTLSDPASGTSEQARTLQPAPAGTLLELNAGAVAQTGLTYIWRDDGNVGRHTYTSGAVKIGNQDVALNFACGGITVVNGTTVDIDDLTIISPPATQLPCG